VTIAQTLAESEERFLAALGMTTKSNVLELAEVLVLRSQSRKLTATAPA
jgi:hypothetical protein